MTNFNYYIEKNDSEIQLKISSNEIELNLIMTENDSIHLIKNIHNADWTERKTIQSGTCLSAKVFWTFDKKNKSISLLIGADDETWDIGLILPFDIIKEIEISIQNKKQ